jgi:hypothetical protein
MGQTFANGIRQIGGSWRTMSGRRVAAAKLIGKEEILAEVQPGALADAVWDVGPWQGSAACSNANPPAPITIVASIVALFAVLLLAIDLFIMLFSSFLTI